MKEIRSAHRKRDFITCLSGQVLRGNENRPAETGVLSRVPGPLTFRLDVRIESQESKTHVLMPQMLQQLQLSVSPLAQDGSRERLHDLLDSDGSTSELILGGTDGFETKMLWTRESRVDVRVVAI
jgi:hypothetical protein